MKNVMGGDSKVIAPFQHRAVVAQSCSTCRTVVCFSHLQRAMRNGITYNCRIQEECIRCP